MGFEIVIKVAAIGLLVAVINQVLSKCGRDEYAMLVTLAGILVIIMMMLPYISELFSSVSSIIDL
ncbi:MAG: stage III sporulation protein AC [Ruminococcaceae bacterium]|nr:stage III sporulation protein AC [Oscillospiraceae bacterium]